MNTFTLAQELARVAVDRLERSSSWVRSNPRELERAERELEEQFRQIIAREEAR